MMDRNKAAELPKLQVGFIDFVCTFVYKVSRWCRVCLSRLIAQCQPPWPPSSSHLHLKSELFSVIPKGGHLHLLGQFLQVSMCFPPGILPPCLCTHLEVSPQMSPPNPIWGAPT